jgi:hypothetical protein
MTPALWRGHFLQFPIAIFPKPISRPDGPLQRTTEVELDAAHGDDEPPRQVFRHLVHGPMN